MLLFTQMESWCSTVMLKKKNGGLDVTSEKLTKGRSPVELAVDLL